MEKLNKSKKLFGEAQQHLVGGVNSPVRAFKAVGGSPVFFQSAKGAYLKDVDGNSYIDFVGSWGPMILGHNPTPVLQAVKGAVEKGTSFGAPSADEIVLAKLAKKAFPSIEKIRFTNSGTEATMSALRLARAYTKRVRIVKFEGGYHGHSDGLLVAAGSGATTFGVSSSAGVPEYHAQFTWVLPYNDASAIEELFTKQGPNIAAVIFEPVCGNMGVVTPNKDFLFALTKFTKQYGALLVCDEVMTGFRLAWGGAQEIYDLNPDLTCLGKIVGGGFPVGAFGGRKDIMDLLAPMGPVYQAGTLSGNPVAMAAGVATLESLEKLNPYRSLQKVGEDLARFITSSAQQKKIKLQVNQIGSMFTVFFNAEPVTSYLSATSSDTKKFKRFFQALLKRGVYMPPSQFESAFISTAHTPDVMAKAKKAFREALSA